MKEERVEECLMSWGKLFQMWGPKCEKVRKPLAEKCSGKLVFCDKCDALIDPVVQETLCLVLQHERTAPRETGEAAE